ncbi:phosphate signaling complex protein PhoU [Evansella sp. LMS18]|uniref:phosphate signaling complex protein PhoU n=1 Tax=Evansella sp. LMS18 TaxID=2924033 RepID=UPI0020D16580|nr:phosphate signaling complex protein PhoU [Evansella sp. LMS18]UTR11219.1 phosphate signaling complex protein PhoU [Evansella sp. LMS18]
MVIREQFSTSLSSLKEDVLNLGSMAEEALSETLKAVSSNDSEKLNVIITNDRLINNKELTINENATLLITKQQPVASDLRKVIVSLKISSDLERIGDLSVDIAKAALRINELLSGQGFEQEIQKMGARTNEMLKAVLSAYRKGDVLEAQKIAAIDDEIDKAYGEFVQSLFKTAVLEPGMIENITQLAFISRYIERIADYSTNIAEWIIYEVNGKKFDLN